MAGDLQAGDRLIKRLNPFVYRRYIDYGAFQSLREMKSLIEREVNRKGMQADVKLGAGGIREVEFIVQAFQLIRGGQLPALREPNLIKVLPQLVELELLPEDVADELTEAYLFLRDVEHRCRRWQINRPSACRMTSWAGSGLPLPWAFLPGPPLSASCAVIGKVCAIISVR